MTSNNSGTIPIYPKPQTERFRILCEEFAAHFNKQPNFLVRVPGRVNLIGEHIDYCGYGVCPMALEQDVVLAVSIEDSDSLIYLHNLDNKFCDFNCDIKNFNISINGAPQWFQYFLCGVKGVIDILPKDTQFKGMKIVVNGIVPQNAGLSSSSALVSAAALATSHAHKFAISKEKMANLCAESERYIGTQGGGMDQAIAFLATEGCAKHIEFSPLRSTDITLPLGGVFVIAHSTAYQNKAAASEFNWRVVECRLAAQIIAKKHNLLWSNIKQLGKLQKELDVDLTEMISIVRKTLHEQPYSKQEVVQELETTSDHLDETSLTENTRHIQSFKLRQRALHVFQEALRVQKFHEACTKSTDENILQTLGKLMRESHESLFELYECSHPLLDTLVGMSSNYTLGSRLTGAGWGGCVVSLVLSENVNKYMDFLKDKFYKVQGVVDNFESVLFVTSPNAGACIYTEQ